MSLSPPNLPPLRKYAEEEIPLAAIIDRMLASIGSGVAINEVSSTVTIRQPPSPGTVVSGDGVPAVSEIAKNSSTYDRPGTSESYAAGTVITYTIAGGTAGEVYWIDFEFTPSTGGGPYVVRQPLFVD